MVRGSTLHEVWRCGVYGERRGEGEELLGKDELMGRGVMAGTREG